MDQNIFKYPDTNSSRAKIDYLNLKFKDQRIAIIGLGGTGSYILDHVAKTPVQEIHLYDGDIFQLHNAFRAPGAIDGNMFEQQPELKKVNYYYNLYTRMRINIFPHEEYVSKDNIGELSQFSYVFVCVDKNEARSVITESLKGMSVPFIDTGLGIHKKEDSLIGTIRVTIGTSEKNEHLKNRIGSGDHDLNEYGDNIQISDLNCMNAMLAVIKWKKLTGFYQDLKKEHNSLYFINTNKLINEDF